MKKSKLQTALATLVTALFSLTAAVAVPILWRGWYALQIGPLGLEDYTGWSRETILDAYNAVLDFLVKGAPFSTGALRYSESGMAHFADCRVLFLLNFLALTLSALFLLVLLRRLLRSTPAIGHRQPSPPLLALAVTAGVFLIFGAWAWLDFESLFTAFHTLCFPGKDNWVFDWRMDEIILILPEAFWARTAALVAGLTLAIEALLALIWALLRRWRTPKTVYEELHKA